MARGAKERRRLLSWTKAAEVGMRGWEVQVVEGLKGWGPEVSGFGDV